MRAFVPFVGLAAFAAAAILPAGLVNAGDLNQPSVKAPARAVLICGTDAATRRAFAREYGSPPVFVTAREALSVRAADGAWNTPRCMTAREHVRYRDAVSTFASVR